MRHNEQMVTFVTVLAMVLAGGASAVLAVEPGVDIAVPRVSIVSANGATLRFVPATVVIEQGDHVRWIVTSGSHTTTSGSSCTSNGLWAANITSLTTPPFTRQFLEAPGPLPYFCAPHCGLQMIGSVIVTTLIDLTTTDVGGATSLNWTGGGGTYRVPRSTSPLFLGASTTVLTPTGGTTQTSFLEQTPASPAVGAAFFYLVMNQF